MSAREFPQVKSLTSPAALRARCAELGVDLAVDDRVEPAPDGPLAQPLVVTDGSAGPLTIGNRFCVLPMEGWDGTDDGRPTDLVRRRWRRFGAGGAKLIWGGEAVAVRHDGRANPRQLRIGDDTWEDLAALRGELVAEHAAHHGRTDDLVVGLQLTHSGRWSRPDGPAAPLVAYRHPLLDRRVAVDDSAVLSDDDLDRLADEFVAAAELAHRAGFAFVDVKACHGYLGHELLSAVDRPGRYGGDLEGRTAFLRRVISGIRSAVPDLAVGVRLSVVDLVPHRAGADGRGEPEPVADGYPYAFGGDGTGLGVDLTEPLALLDELAGLGVGMVCVTAASPYYAPHAQRPAWFPPSDGYRPPRDPLVDVAALLDVAAALAGARPDVAVVGSGWSYLQEWLPHVAQAAVAAGRVHSVGLGRMALSYPELPADVLTGRPLTRRQLCRTFSDCTTAPRNGLVSGCYPLDPFYKARPERVELAAAKRRG
ncbi:MAG TPA: NADH:flavin oxidoreductase [Acidimicrobiales bacterium]|nr:NADH:flavin oxidoreductase [Acidimicrobiales bacterium]